MHIYLAEHLPSLASCEVLFHFKTNFTLYLLSILSVIFVVYYCLLLLSVTVTSMFCAAETITDSCTAFSKKYSSYSEKSPLRHNRRRLQLTGPRRKFFQILVKTYLSSDIKSAVTLSRYLVRSYVDIEKSCMFLSEVVM